MVTQNEVFLFLSAVALDSHITRRGKQLQANHGRQTAVLCATICLKRRLAKIAMRPLSHPVADRITSAGSLVMRNLVVY